jgi:hypothetical protein
MVCRTLRNRSWRGIILSLTVCVALAWPITALPLPWLEDETTSLTSTAPDLPLAALATNPNVRMEKQGQFHRLSIKKPERGARVSPAARIPHPRPLMRTPQASRILPRRQLHVADPGPGSPDDPSQPFLS